MYHTYKNGFIEVVCGPMFAGKTEELIRRIKRLEYAKQNVLVFKPKVDTRYAREEIVSHNMSKKPSIIIDKSTEILKFIKDDTDAVVIDEVQFFDHDIVNIAEHLADQGIRVIVGGLDRDFRGESFGPMPDLLSRAEFVTKLTAICVKSGLPATRTQRIINGKPAHYEDPTILVGANESYEPRSRHYHEVPGKPKKYKYMRAALKEAEKAALKDEVPVGAVVVYKDKIIARAHNLRESKQIIHGHAEFLAMMKAAKKIGSWRLEDCDIYVTMEPCPMCAGAMIQSRIKKVYYGVKDYKAGVADSVCQLFDLPFNHRVETEGLIMHEESKKMIKKFF